MALKVNETRHNLRTKHYFANPRKYGYKPIEDLTYTSFIMSSCSSLGTQTDKQTHKHTIVYLAAHAHTEA